MPEKRSAPRLYEAWSNKQAILGGPSRAIPVYSRSICGAASWEESPRVRTVQQRLRRRQWLSFWGVLRIRSDPSIRPGCYTAFSWMLNLCYKERGRRKELLHAFTRRGAISRLFLLALPGPSRFIRDLFAKQFLGKNHPECEQSNKGSGGGNGYHSGMSSEFVLTPVSAQVVTRLFRGC